MLFPAIRAIDEIALNILQKRYFWPGETTWEQIAQRVVTWVLGQEDDSVQEEAYHLIANRYFVPNSPCLVNSGNPDGGLIACFVVDLLDSIDEIYRTKYEFALIARKGGGCGTDLSHLRPKNTSVKKSVHGFAGGPVAFGNTICGDMKALTQSGFREMAMMLCMSVYHPDIMEFINSKATEGVMHTTNISVVVDNDFMEKVRNNEQYQTQFVYQDGTIYFGPVLSAKDVFDKIVDGAWRNGEPGLLFDNQINNSPYRHTGQYIYATNPCGEQPLPPNGCCNLGSIDLSKFVQDGQFNYPQFSKAIDLAVLFLDSVIDVNSFPTAEIEQWAKENRPVGLGIMGLADLYLQLGIAYGSPEAITLLDNILSFMLARATKISEYLGQRSGVPVQCRKLPTPRRNITVTTIAPTGTISLLAGCSNGIEPIFSELVTRQDNTGKYTISHPDHDKPHFRCAVSTNGSTEVTWQEHIETQCAAQKHIDSGVSKTINFPNKATRKTIAQAFMAAWQQGAKGITVYRNDSRQVQVLTPKNLQKHKCPECGNNLVTEAGCQHCSCGFSMCDAS